MVILSVLVSALVIADADVSFTVPSPIVKDVPFDISVEMNSNNDNVARIQLYTTSQSQQINFLSASRGSWLPDSIVQKNEVLLGGKTWWYNIGPTAPNFESSTEFKNVVTVRAQTKVDDTLQLTPADNVVARYPDGSAINIIPTTQSIATSNSACGDGVVGYFDTNSNGIQEDTESREACDEGSESGVNKNAASGGCITQCTYVELGYSCTNTNFGDRNSACTRMSRKDFFLTKMNAFFNNQCYPTNTHPDKIYGWFCDNLTNNDIPSANTIIGAVSEALLTYLTSS